MLGVQGFVVRVQQQFNNLLNERKSWASAPPPDCIAQALKPIFYCHHAASSSGSSRTIVALAASSCCRRLSSDAWTSRATVPQSLHMRRMLQVSGEETQRSSTVMWGSEEVVVVP